VVGDLDAKDVVIKALKMEALQKPDERIILGRTVLTYRQFAEMLGGGSGDGKVIDEIIKSAVLMFKNNPAFRERMLRLAGEVSG
jgi:hypothetical protein